MPGAREGKRIEVGHVARFHDPLPGAQMPPEIGVDGVARRHRQQTEEQDSCERYLRRAQPLENSSHVLRGYDPSRL